MRRNLPYRVFLIALAVIGAMGWSLYDAFALATRESSEPIIRGHAVLEIVASIE